jgi:hypothetical protein
MSCNCRTIKKRSNLRSLITVVRTTEVGYAMLMKQYEQLEFYHVIVNKVVRDRTDLFSPILGIIFATRKTLAREVMLLLVVSVPRSTDYLTFIIRQEGR